MPRNVYSRQVAYNFKRPNYFTNIPGSVWQSSQHHHFAGLIKTGQGRLVGSTSSPLQRMYTPTCIYRRKSRNHMIDGHSHGVNTYWTRLRIGEHRHPHWASVQRGA